MVRFYPVPLYVTVPTGASRSVSSNPLSGATSIAEILMIFPGGTSLNLTYRFFMLARQPTNNTVNPGAGELTATEITPGYFPGDGIAYVVPFQKPINPTQSILCLYATNNVGVQVNAAAIAIVGSET